MFRGTVFMNYLRFELFLMNFVFCCCKKMNNAARWFENISQMFEKPKIPFADSGNLKGTSLIFSQL